MTELTSVLYGNRYVIEKQYTHQRIDELVYSGFR